MAYAARLAAAQLDASAKLARRGARRHPRLQTTGRLEREASLSRRARAERVACEATRGLTAWRAHDDSAEEEGRDAPRARPAHLQAERRVVAHERERAGGG